MAAAISGGEIRINDVIPRHLEAVLDKLREAGCGLKAGEDWVELTSPESRLRSVNIRTAPLPGFPH